jgi:hypothetical protein
MSYLFYHSIEKKSLSENYCKIYYPTYQAR